MRLLPVVCLLAGCTTVERPTDLLRAYRDALTEKSGRRAYHLLSRAEKRAIRWDRFEVEWKANEQERRELADELAHATFAPEVRRSVQLSDGHRMELIRSGGWAIVSPRLQGADCPTPEAALTQLFDALRIEENSQLISILSPEFRKELLQQLHERQKALQTAPSEALEVTGDRAILRVGRFRVELRQIDGQWKISDFN